MSGLRSSFSRPRRTYGATANVKTRAFQTPVTSSYKTPSAVRSNIDIDDYPGYTSHFDFAQQHSSAHIRPVAGASSTPASAFSPHFRRGGQQSIRESSGRRQSLTHVEPREKAPVPCYTLRARLSLESWKTVQLTTKAVNMKTVDRTPVQFKKRFSGLPGEDWIAHVDALEIHRANKHQWTARQFYYGLQHTLTGKARLAIQALEEELDCPTLYAILPDWFEAEMEELRAMIANSKLLVPQSSVCLQRVNQPHLGLPSRASCSCSGSPGFARHPM